MNKSNNNNNDNPLACEQISFHEEDYLNGALAGKPEEERVLHHLQNCAGCSAQFQADRELLGRLFGSMQPVTPPSFLKTSLLARLTQLNPPQAGSLAQPASAPSIAPRPPGKPAFDRPGKWLRFPGLALAGLASLVLGLSLWLVVLNNELQNTREQQVQYQQLISMSTSPGSIMWEMRTGQAYDPTAPYARMYVENGSNFYLVTGTNFQSAPPGQVYRFWYIQSAQLQAGGSLFPNEQGRIVQKINRLDHLTGRTEITSCFITLEKVDASGTQPFGSPLVRWTKGVE